MAKTRQKIPRFESFAVYVTLGRHRSYEAVAESLGVSRRGIEELARRDRWVARLREVEARAQERVEEQLVESLAAMKHRQLQTLRVVNARALEALQSHPLRSAMEAVRALEMSIKLERVITGMDNQEEKEVVQELKQREEDSLLAGVGADDDPSTDPCDIDFELVDDMSDESGEAKQNEDAA